MDKRISNIRERIEGWPEEAQSEIVGLIEEIETDFLSSVELSEDDIVALVTSEEDVRHNRYARDEDITALFQRH